MCPTLLGRVADFVRVQRWVQEMFFQVVVVSSISTAVGDASPALLLFKVECWCLIASAENTPGLKNNAATIIVVVASVVLFEITEDCRRLHDDLISSLRNALFTT
jgi:hypothetical protein